ncbi:MAG TPA: response regulator [Patescibacteria group bacterium]|nr:response regulator [Patescibacteria group bacterium]
MKCVLIVDDVPTVRLVIKKILARAGFTSIEAADGVEALSLLDIHYVDTVVTDIWMSGMDGLQFLDILKRKWPGIAVVAMTGGAPQKGQEESLERARDAGATQLLMKPIDKDELVAAVLQALSAITPHTA